MSKIGSYIFVIFEIGHFWDFLVIYPRDFGAKKMKKKYQKSQKLVKKGANFKAQF